MSSPLVMKFGGSSVADAGRLANVAALAKERSGDGVLLVLSALAKVTDGLFAAAEAAKAGRINEALGSLDAILDRHRRVAAELSGSVAPEAEAFFSATREELAGLLRGASLLKTLPERTMDVIAGRGELLSTRIMASHLGSPWVDARAVLRTDSRFGRARPDTAATEAACRSELLPLLVPGAIVVTQGYIGSDAAGNPTTLGRGGSDYSASILGAAVNAREIQIWTDVEGVLTGDPRVVSSPAPVEVLGYDEAAELAAFGAKVLHPATILPAVEKGIPVTVRDSLQPGGRLTTISRGSASGRAVTALASRGPVTILTVRSPRMLGGSGFLARIFEVFGRRGVNVDLVATSEVSVSASIDDQEAAAALAAELSAFGEVRVARDRALVALVGERLAHTPGVAGKAFSALGTINVDMISMGSDEINLSFVVAQADAALAQRRLHDAFFGGRSEDPVPVQGEGHGTGQPQTAAQAAAREEARAL